MGKAARLHGAVVLDATAAGSADVVLSVRDAPDESSVEHPPSIATARTEAPFFSGSTVDANSRPQALSLAGSRKTLWKPRAVMASAVTVGTITAKFTFA